MRILLLTHAFNSLTQRLFVELGVQGHDVSVEFDIQDEVAVEAVALHRPQLIIAPFLKRAIPEEIWRPHICLVVHPGIPGDRGPSALDWAILNGETRWGVTVLQANEEMDAGDIWAWSTFKMRCSNKATLYRNEVTEAAVKSVLFAVKRHQQRDYRPIATNAVETDVRGKLRPLVRQQHRTIDWHQDDTKTVLRKIRSADGYPGVRDEMFGRELYLYDACPEVKLRGAAGEPIARCGGAICRATTDGALWIGHLRDRQSEHPFKLPATLVLGEKIKHLPQINPGPQTGYRDIWYEEEGKVGYLFFPFYNGAMGTEQCRRLLELYRMACLRQTRIIVLLGGPDYWSNGMHLNLIEAADSPADESWRNINAIDDLALALIDTHTHLTIAALQGNAGAGGVFLARAADEVWARKGVILNPHYKDMGNLYGSEYWSYLLTRYAGKENAKRIIQARLPMGTEEAISLGLLNKSFVEGGAKFVAAVKRCVAEIANSPTFESLLEQKRIRRLADEDEKPLQHYREQELEEMHRNFYGFDPSYHVARYNFVHKIPKSRTPLTLARHRRTGRRYRSAS